MGVYYNEIDPYAAQWLRNLIKAGHIANGDVDERSILDVTPNDLKPYTQWHFFAGIGGWSLALRYAGWPDDRPAWTGSCPCQPFSTAGAGGGFSDERHLWPAFFHLISECEPPVIFGEQVASATEWLGNVRSDMEALGYAVGAIPIEAASAGAQHRRDRFWFVADSQSDRWEQRLSDNSGVPQRDQAQGEARRTTLYGADDRVRCKGIDGKWRAIEPGIRLLAHGVPSRVGRLRAYGNAIDPKVASLFIKSFMEG